MPAPEGSEIIYRFGDFELSPRERRLTRDAERVALTPRMFDLLLALVEADGRLLGKETLLDTVWADAAVEEGNLNRTISALRKALGETKGELKYIETVPKAGYRFVAHVAKGMGGEVRRRDLISEAAPVSSQPKTRSRFPLFAAVGAFFLLFGSLTISYFVFSQSERSRTETTTGPKIVRLTNDGFDADAAAWTSDDRIRFLRFPAVNKVESMIMNQDGSDQRLTGNEIKDFRAGTWSPDGRLVIYSKNGTSPRTSFIANADGSDERQLQFNIGPFDWSSDGKHLVYSTNYPTESDSSEIVLYSLETGELTNLTNHTAFDANPSFSPDGRQVIFNSDRDGNAEVYLMNSDGTGLRRLTNDPAKEAFQAFSPDGTQIVFNSNRENEKVGMYLMNVNDDLAPVRLSNVTHNAEIRPGCWSRDGTKIVFTSDMNGEKFNVYSMTVEPVRAARVVDDPNGEIRSAALSPDGRTFASAVKLPDGSGELRSMDALSRVATTLSSAENFDLLPAWSPDGKSVAFAMKTGGNTEIFAIDADGRGLKNLTNHDARDGGPAWSPDGTKIAFSSDRDGRSEIVSLFIMNADGSDPKRLNSRHGYGMTPAWSPDGKTIAYAGDRADGTSQALDIFAANVSDPSTEHVLTSRRYHDTNPTFSPDGRRLAFVAQADGNFEIYLMNADGSGLVRLTRNSADDTMPIFSRDGTKVYFISNRDGKFALYEIGI